MKKFFTNFKSLEFIGSIFTFLLSVLLYFCYDFSNGATYSIIFFAANHSIWEQIKLLTITFISWAFIELTFVRIPIKKFIVSKTLAVYTIVSLYILAIKFTSLFFQVTPIYINAILAFSVLASAFFISYKIIQSNKNFGSGFTIAVFSLILFFSMFMTFTVCPLHLDIFQDPITKSYGIPQ